MKTFLVTVSTLCLCGILLCFVAYATGNLPIPKVTKLPPVSVPPQQATTVETEKLCSPCVEKMASILAVMGKEWEADWTVFVEQPATPFEKEVRGWEVGTTRTGETVV